jgi:hypothetical protein
MLRQRRSMLIDRKVVDLLFLFCSNPSRAIFGSHFWRLVMSMEIFVLSDKRLGTIDEGQQAIDAEGFDLRLDTSRPFEDLSGHLPAHRGEQHAGFECDHWDPLDVMDEESCADIDFGRRWTQALAFRFGGDFHALWAAYAAAAAYAKATDGVVFDGESGEVLPPEKAAQVARDIERDLPSG